MTFPLPYTVTRVRPGAGDGAEDDLGNPIPVPDVRDAVKVAGWAIPSSDEPKVAGHDRLVVEIELLAPPGLFQPGDAVELPGEDTVFEVIGRPENYEHGPWSHEWSPGLETVNLKKWSG